MEKLPEKIEQLQWIRVIIIYLSPDQFSFCDDKRQTASNKTQ